MFKAILSFFRALFGGKNPGAGTVSREVTPAEAKELEWPQDGADLPSDSLEIPILQPTVIASPPVEKPVVLEAEANPSIPELPKTQHTPKYHWCLDNGHGEDTPGKRSPKFDDGSQMFEYELVRDVNRRIMARLDEFGVKYTNLVPELKDISLKERVIRANDLTADLPKIYLSIHANAAGSGGWATASGMECWYMVGSTRGQKLASVFQKHLVPLGWKDRGIRFRTPAQQSFYVLRKTSMPAVLTENGFYTDLAECTLLRTDEFRQKIAEAHVQAILETEKKGMDDLDIYPKNTEIRVS